MKPFILNIFLIFIFIISHGQLPNKQIQKTVSLENNFKIEVGSKEEFDKLTTYTLFILSRNDKPIFTDSSLTEYEFGDTLYPIVHKTGKNSFEILAEVNNRPNKNYLKRFQIIEYRLTKIDTLPTFFGKAKNLDNDPKLEYAGIWDYGEEWDDSLNQRLTVYNPIIYYELGAKGLQLDTSLTIEKNQMIYGAFKGYQYNERSSIKISDLGDRLIIEIARIENKGK